MSTKMIVFLSILSFFTPYTSQKLQQQKKTQKMENIDSSGCLISRNNNNVYSLSIYIVNKNMKQKLQVQEDELKISEFIKDPVSLKLLILAGTNIQVLELPTISKCTGLIKLDLSANYLPELPLRFHIFPNMKILYLHDNQLTSVDIRKTNLEYISLFSNPILSSEYRSTLIDQNSKLLAVDHHVVTKYEREKIRNDLPLYTQLKWPIVEITTQLQHEEDYLNLLKAEIFVINNVYKRTQKAQIIEAALHSFVQRKKMESFQGLGFYSQIFKTKSVVKAAKKWIQYTRLRKKLRAILAKKGKQSLLDNQFERKRKQRSIGVSLVMEAFIPLVRLKMKARQICQRQVRAFKRSIPVQKELFQNYLKLDQEQNIRKNPIKLYFKRSEEDILSKVCLFAKKLLFQEKEYDLCDDFNDLFRTSGKAFYIFRSKEKLKDEKSWLLNSIHQTIHNVLHEVGLDRQYILYTKKGHKKIGLKAIKKLSESERNSILEKAASSTKKINRLYEKYDQLIEYKVEDWKILRLVMKIIKYINAGNSKTIIHTQTAYFQTQVQQEDDDQKIKMYFGLEHFNKRTIAANVIQRFWRRMLVKKNEEIKVIQEIRRKRGQLTVKKWLNNLIFSHRTLRQKMSSYQRTLWKESDVYFYLDVYMNMLEPTNYLRYVQKMQNKQDFYELIHQDTQTQIVENGGRRWLRISYPDAKTSFEAQKCLSKFTYRYYYNGFYLKFFTRNEISNPQFLAAYEKKIKHLYGLTINVGKDSHDGKLRSLWVQNPFPNFLWSEIEPEETVKKFGDIERKKAVISIFIYNKHKRPLKVSCEFTWIAPQSIYLGSAPKINQSVAVTPRKKSLPKLQESIEGLYFFKHHANKRQKQKQQRRNSLGSQNRSILKSHRSRLVSDIKLDIISESMNMRLK